MKVEKLINWIKDIWNRLFGEQEVELMFHPLPTEQEGIIVTAGKYRLTILGGPMYNAHTAEGVDLYINMANEIKLPDLQPQFRVECVDFQSPGYVRMTNAVEMVMDLPTNSVVYIGCMGGTGRTGTGMAVLIAEICRQFGKPITGEEAIDLVRGLYRRHAVETTGQEKFIDRFVSSRVSLG